MNSAFKADLTHVLRDPRGDCSATGLGFGLALPCARREDLALADGYRIALEARLRLEDRQDPRLGPAADVVRVARVAVGRDPCHHGVSLHAPNREARSTSIDPATQHDPRRS